MNVERVASEKGFKIKVSGDFEKADMVHAKRWSNVIANQIAQEVFGFGNACVSCECDGFSSKDGSFDITVCMSKGVIK